jgi:hypothetical protein
MVDGFVYVRICTTLISALKSKVHTRASRSHHTYPHKRRAVVVFPWRVFFFFFFSFPRRVCSNASLSLLAKVLRGLRTWVVVAQTSGRVTRVVCVEGYVNAQWFVKTGPAVWGRVQRMTEHRSNFIPLVSSCCPLGLSPVFAFMLFPLFQFNNSWFENLWFIELQKMVLSSVYYREIH